MKNKKKADNSGTQNAEELHFENELLKLQIQAEFGASPVSVTDIPPEMENLFLKNILKIEQAFAKHETISLYDKIGRPPTAKANELDDAAIERAALALEQLFNKKGIFVTFRENETSRNKYIFITERLFNSQVDNLGMPEIMMHFDCTDFENDEDDDFDN